MLKWMVCRTAGFLITGSLFFIFNGCGTSSYRITEKIPLTIRVAVEKNSTTINLISKDAYFIYRGSHYQLPSHSTIELNDESVFINGTPYPFPVTISSPHLLSLNGKKYSGDILLNGFYVINIIQIEEYLKGVLSSEVDESWPIEALKTQAVVSRTYAFKKVLQNKSELYDIEDTVLHQKFVYEENNSRINSAIHETNGIIILFQNKPVEAFFHSCSGGITENCGDIFQQDIPYLRSIPDPYSSGYEHIFWTFSSSETDIKEALKGILEKKFELRSLKNVKIYKKTGSGRVKEFILIFKGNEKQILKGNTFRLALDPKAFRSLLIQDIQKKRINDEYIYTFSGKGYGHGVGLSQWGVKGMAEQGFAYERIIAYYYRGTQLGNYDMVSLP